MNKPLKYICIILVILLVSFSSNDNDIKSIDDLAYVVAIGVDLNDSSNLEITYQVSIPTSLTSDSSGVSSSDSTFFLKTIECSSIDSGINLLNSLVSKKINFSNCKAIIISEKIAENGISDYIFSLLNYSEISPQCNVIISKCLAKDVLENSKPTLENLAAKYYEVVPSSSEYTGYTVDVNLGSFFSTMSDSFRQNYAILVGINNKMSSTTNLTNSNRK